METAKTPSEKPNSDAGKSSLSGLRFNSTGRDDTTVEVMKMQRDPGAGKKIAVFIALFIFVVFALRTLYLRSDLKINDALNGESKPSFGSTTPNEEVK